MFSMLTNLLFEKMLLGDMVPRGYHFTRCLGPPRYHIIGGYQITVTPALIRSWVKNVVEGNRGCRLLFEEMWYILQHAPYFKLVL